MSLLAKVRTAIALSALLLLVLSVPATLYLMSEVSHSPLKMDAREGFIYPFNNHGVIHYFTWLPHVIDVATQWSILFVVPVGLITVLWLKFGRHRYGEVIPTKNLIHQKLAHIANAILREPRGGRNLATGYEFTGRRAAIAEHCIALKRIHRPPSRRKIVGIGGGAEMRRKFVLRIFAATAQRHDIP